ncbi:WD40 repeat-like protein [Aspergillus campestris IBT 28561]|uniref:WD40 repeat-like protein n=1 Tax=Aspergillus campestris (strain IBT 28561) TaxID=1392248 RepID=A0A2I1CY57_ASPC2|nr:WD40 repeat-like protein [Aspergillus campestris IBT 28561]PKY02557.1 WD40 repeat-like protein [Aspergillus campestris IBT 28561]
MDIHRCRFVPYNPQAINSLAFSHPPSADLKGRGIPTLRLAVGRANGDIEIWNPMRGAWFQETVLRGGKDRSIEGLAWTQDPAEPGPDEKTQLPGRLRLFSIGYSTAVTEWDLEQGRPVRNSSGNYGEIWCLAAQPRWQAPASGSRGKDGKQLPAAAEGQYTGQHLAAGCADGSIVILSTADNDLRFLRLMRPSTKRSRVLSVTFQDRNTIVAGYADSSIRLFDIRNGQLLRTISLGRGPAGGSKELLVWSVKCLPDGTIVSGDSAGEIRFWDAKNYSLIQRLQGHLADTLDVAVSANGDTVISGGADQRTVVYRKNDGDKGDKKSRWAEVMHRRYHTHDVKTFAVYETRDISVVVSGGPDATPVILPLREFGKEHHRALSTLPQVSQLASAPSSRLVMSFWDREVSIWRMSRGPGSVHESVDGPKHRLVGKVLIQGEENITSAMLSSDGKILVVATISSVKVFSVRRRKGDEKGTLRIQKLEAPAALADDGARVVTVSPDSRWVCVVRPNSAVYTARIKPASSPQDKPQILSQLVKLNRAPRRSRHEKASHGTLGEYERTIRCAVFSEDSRVLATGDLSGCVDTWTLENATEASKPTTTTDSDSDSESEDDSSPTLEGERWRMAASDPPIPRLTSGIAVLSFRPSNPATATSTPRLMAITSEHQLVEFDALSGKLSDWSRRNPKAYLPQQFRGVKDRVMGCLWDLTAERERLWLFGSSWLWMFDLNQDFPSPEELTAASDDAKQTALVEASSSANKRKREDDDAAAARRKKPNSGAGDRIPDSEEIYLSRFRKTVVGADESHSEWVSLEGGNNNNNNTSSKKDNEDDDEDEDNTAAHEARLARLRRADPSTSTSTSTPQKKKSKHLLTEAALDSTPLKQQVQLSQTQQDQGTRRWWHTYKYRDVLGIVPLGGASSSSSDSDSDADADVKEVKENGEESGAPNTLEVAIIERPMWDVELPGRYVRDYE